MKKNILILVLFTTFFQYTYATEKFIHNWVAAGTTDWRTSIDFSNSCDSRSAKVNFKFWNSDGSPLANQQLYLVDAQSEWIIVTTDALGELNDIVLNPHESKRVIVQHTFFSGGTGSGGTGSFIGNASIITEPGIKCVTAGYFTWSNGTSGNSGTTSSFIINNGDRF